MQVNSPGANTSGIGYSSWPALTVNVRRAVAVVSVMSLSFSLSEPTSTLYPNPVTGPNGTGRISRYQVTENPAGSRGLAVVARRQVTPAMLGARTGLATALDRRVQDRLDRGAGLA